jgi:hypothetical protein
LEFRFKKGENVVSGDAEEERRLGAAKKELDYVDKILDDDSKNYHVS